MFAVTSSDDYVMLITINVLLEPFIHTPDQLKIKFTNTYSAEILKLLALENRRRLSQAQAYLYVTSACNFACLRHKSLYLNS